ncbi:MAG: hypothetical protein JNL81_10615 [Hyphomonadaceae bacterium]|nr:hypothetical protein [Hyphomonadaceae bacterium]
MTALTACAPPPVTTATAPTIGILEERPGATADEAPRHVVRALFHKGASGWLSYDPDCSDEACLRASAADFPQATLWTISSHGQAFGEVSARTPRAWALYADVGQQELAADANPPTIGQRSNEYAPDASVPLHRPLIATSPAAYADPHGWNTSPATPEAQHAVRRAFAAQFANVTNCANAETAPQPRAYADADIELSQSYLGGTGWRVMTARLTDYTCDGPLEGAYAEQAYAVSPSNEARLLGEGYRFLDAGDYDNDGQSEIIFAISQYNTGGYALFTADFAHNAVFDVSYH